MNEDYSSDLLNSEASTSKKLDSIPEEEIDEGESSKDVALVDNINEYEFDSDWDSDVELIEPPAKQKKYFGKNINPALAYMLEYSGLSQEQIYTIIQQNKKLESDRKSNASSTGSNKASTSKSIKKLLPVKEEPNDTVKTDPEDEESVKKSTSLNKSSESSDDDFVEVSNTSTTEKSTNENSTTSKIFAKTMTKVSSSRKRPEKVVELMSTDSDSDDFITVPNAKVEAPAKRQGNSINMEIVIKPDSNVEDDLFADVFESNNESLSNSKLPDESENFIGSSSSELNESANSQKTDLASPTKFTNEEPIVIENSSPEENVSKVEDIVKILALEKTPEKKSKSDVDSTNVVPDIPSASPKIVAEQSETVTVIPKTPLDNVKSNSAPVMEESTAGEDVMIVEKSPKRPLLPTDPTKLREMQVC